MTYYLIPVTEQSDSLTLGRTRKVRPHRGTRGGGGLMYPPCFLICCNISKRFCLQWKVLDLLNMMRCILCVIALLEVFDVTKHGRHRGFYQELEIR